MNNLKIANENQIAEAHALVAATTYAASTFVYMCDCCGERHVCNDINGVPIYDSCLVDGELASLGLRLPTENERAMAVMTRMAEASNAGFGV